MPFRPKRYRPDQPATIYLRTDGRLHNAIADAAGAAGLSIQEWALSWLVLRVNDQFPPPPPKAPLPNLDTQLRAYLTGEMLLEPCGEQAPCARAEAGTQEVDSVSFCRSCWIRVE